MQTVTASPAVDSFLARFVAARSNIKAKNTKAEEQGDRLFDSVSDIVPRSRRGKVINIRT